MSTRAPYAFNGGIRFARHRVRDAPSRAWRFWPARIRPNRPRQAARAPALGVANLQSAATARTPSPFRAARNAANAGGIIAYASPGMTRHAPVGTPTTTTSPYIRSASHEPSPTAWPSPFQVRRAHSAANEIYYPTSWGALQQHHRRHAGAHEGHDLASTRRATITYNASACQTGADTFVIGQRRPADTTDIRSYTVSIAGPTDGPTISSGGRRPDRRCVSSRRLYDDLHAELSVAHHIQRLEPAARLTINTSTGVVSGTPTTVGYVQRDDQRDAENGHTTGKAVQFDITSGRPSSPARTRKTAPSVRFSYQITATNTPDELQRQRIAGRPQRRHQHRDSSPERRPCNGSFPVNVSATNATGTGNQS
jgi:hypothetical protein